MKRVNSIPNTGDRLFYQMKSPKQRFGGGGFI